MNISILLLTTTWKKFQASKLTGSLYTHSKCVAKTFSLLFERNLFNTPSAFFCYPKKSESKTTYANGFARNQLRFWFFFIRFTWDSSVTRDIFFYNELLIETLWSQTKVKRNFLSKKYSQLAIFQWIRSFCLWLLFIVLRSKENKICVWKVWNIKPF